MKASVSSGNFIPIFFFLDCGWLAQSHPAGLFLAWCFNNYSKLAFKYTWLCLCEHLYICVNVHLYTESWNVKSGSGFWAHPIHLHTYCKNYYCNFTEDGPPSCLNLFSKENLITFKCHLSFCWTALMRISFFLMPNDNLLPCNFNVPFLILSSGTILSRFLYNNCLKDEDRYHVPCNLLLAQLHESNSYNCPIQDQYCMRRLYQ